MGYVQCGWACMPHLEHNNPCPALQLLTSEMGGTAAHTLWDRYKRMLAMRHAVRRLGKASKRFQRRTAAAVKLQAAFRAHKARQLAQQLRAARDWKVLVGPRCSSPLAQEWGAALSVQELRWVRKCPLSDRNSVTGTWLGHMSMPGDLLWSYGIVCAGVSLIAVGEPFHSVAAVKIPSLRTVVD